MSTKVVARAIFILLSVFTVNLSHAAFPIKQEGNVVGVTAITLPGNDVAERTILTPKRQWRDAELVKEKKEGKKQAVAALLAFFLGGFGAHRFYLGYNGQGIAQAFTMPLFITLLMIILAGVTVTDIMFFGLFLLAGIVIALCMWELLDFIRIISNDLKPKDGEYIKGRK